MRLVPACNGTEQPTMIKGRRVQYMWNTEANAKNGERSHVYIDLDTDIILTDDEADRLLSSN